MYYVDLDTFNLVENRVSKYTIPYRQNQDIPLRDLPKFISALKNLLSMQVAPTEAFREVAFSMPEYASVMYDIKESVLNGNSVAESICIVPSLKKFRPLIELGFRSGKLIETLTLLKEYFEVVSYVDKKVNSVLRQPTLYAVVSAILMVSMILYLFPRIGRMLEDVARYQLPKVTVLMLNLSNKPILVWFLAISYVVVFIKYQKPIYMNMPIVGKPVKRLFKNLDVYLISSLMALGISSGMRVVDVVEMLEDMNYTDANIKKGLESMKEKLFNGLSLKDAYNDMLPRDIRVAIVAGEASGKIADLLFDVAKVKAEEISIDTEQASVAIQNASIIIIGIMVAVVVGSLYLSILSFVANVGAGGFGGTTPVP
ncbi:MAG: type II secretion system F family protein [Thermoproteota archaeon]